MLTQIELGHFKCFELLKLPLRPLTLLSGANASGKSSVMQALALLHQTMQDHEWSSRLMLNGRAVRLGTVADVIDREHGCRSLEITLEDNGSSWLRWEFEGEPDETSLSVRRAQGEIQPNRPWNVEDPGRLRCLLPLDVQPAPADTSSLVGRLRNLAYLAAERTGPREIRPLQDPRRAPAVDAPGEAAVGVRHTGGDEQVLEGLAIAGVPLARPRQVEARMARLFPHCELRIAKASNADAMTLGVRTSRKTGFFRPAHTGFGLAWTLPVVAAALSAGSGDLLLVENPEAHLHPAGQAAVGTFMAEAAAAGVQVIIETHSDHVLNGVRRAVKDGTLPFDRAALHFFRPRDAGEPGDAAQVVSPMLDGNGDIDRWPEGFFDQFDKDMDRFASWH